MGLGLVGNYIAFFKARMCQSVKPSPFVACYEEGGGVWDPPILFWVPHVEFID